MASRCEFVVPFCPSFHWELFGSEIFSILQEQERERENEDSPKQNRLDSTLMLTRLARKRDSRSSLTMMNVARPTPWIWGSELELGVASVSAGCCPLWDVRGTRVPSSCILPTPPPFKWQCDLINSAATFSRFSFHLSSGFLPRRVSGFTLRVLMS